jgi:hypothetical protein
MISDPEIAKDVSRVMLDIFRRVDESLAAAGNGGPCGRARTVRAITPLLPTRQMQRECKPCAANDPHRRRESQKRDAGVPAVGDRAEEPDLARTRMSTSAQPCGRMGMGKSSSAPGYSAVSRYVPGGSPPTSNEPSAPVLAG